MRILKDGDMSLVSWWYVLTPWICDHCGCEFQVTEDDVPAMDIVNDVRCAIVRCPYCRGRVEKSEDDPNTRLARTRRRLGDLGSALSPGHRKGG